MRKILLATTIFAASITGAFAADAVEEVVAVEEVATVYDWSGIYIGAFGGYGWGNAELDGFDGDFDVDGGLGGAHIGYNFVAGAWVFGLESEFGWTGLSGDVGGVVLGLPVGVEGDLNWFGSTTGRVGYAFDNILVYGKGGVSYGELEVSGTGALAGLGQDDTSIGWTAGAGVEMGFTESIIGRLEYQYYDFGSFESDVAGLPEADFDMHTIKAAISFKF
jgi:outer membrane immunogenic protein